MREDPILRARRLDRAVAVALATFNEMPGVLSTAPLAERVLRLRAVDAAIEALGQAEELRRRLRWKPSPDRQAYAELLARLKAAAGAAPRGTPVDTLTGLRPGDSARVVVRVDHATPQELASLSALVRSLPEGAVAIEPAASPWTERRRRRTRRPVHLSPVPPSMPPNVPPAAG